LSTAQGSSGDETDSLSREWQEESKKSPVQLTGL
jgi:hypothetical protein